MQQTPRETVTGLEISSLWDGMDFLGRLKIIMDHRDLFWDLGLVTTSELAMASRLSESDREYVLNREDCPIFTSLNLKKQIENQYHREKMKAALRAVFLKAD